MILPASVLIACASPDDDTAASADEVDDVAEAPAPPAVPPCDWITEARASELLGAPVQYVSERDAATCELGVPDGDGMGPDVTIEAMDPSTADYDYVASVEAAEPVDGVGDRAVWVPMGEAMGTVYAETGGRVLQVMLTDISATSGPAGGLREKAVAVARAVVAEM